jgi:crotonobetainyl-CoA:carnitine CoA-transferase CaiB-like acyl-CoA transferase
MSGPLAGIKVIELAEYGFVPSAAAALADWGADVVKIERPEGDPLRRTVASGGVESAGGFDYLVETANRNKRGICLDLRVPGGRELLDRLVAWADVFITSQLPRVLRKHRLESHDLIAINPRLVYARGHGQGQKGPEAEVGGYDGVSFFARAGIGHMLTPPGAPSVIGPRPAFGDHPSGVQLAGGVAAALVKVLRTGEAVVVDMALLAGGIWQLGPDLACASVTGRAPEKTDPSKVRSSPLIATYHTSDERFLLLVMHNEERYWPKLCRALERDDLVAHPAYTTPEQRSENRSELFGILSGVFASRPLAHWEPRLRDEGCIFSKYASPEEVLRDPQVEINGYMPQHPTVAGARLPATPQQFDDQPVEILRPAPRLGEHTDEVLREVGLAESEIAKLRAASAIR